jgi:hypothetical protein
MPQAFVPLSIRLSPETHAEVSRIAEARGVSINRAFNQLLESSLKAARRASARATGEPTPQVTS